MEVQRSGLQLGFGLGSLNSTLRFKETSEVKIKMNTASLSGSWQVYDRWSVRGGLGVILDGDLTPADDIAQNVLPGGVAAIGFEYLAINGEGYKPYMDLSLFLSGSATEIENPVSMAKTSYVSSDLRLGGRASWNIKSRVFPYIAARLFGGPVSWTLDGEDVTGSDIHHYQVALGTAIQFGQVGTFFEWSGVGEKTMSAGISYAL